MKTLYMLLAAALILGSCQTKREKEQETDRSQATIDSLQRVIAQSNSESEDLANTISQIRDGFRQINEAENRVTVDQGETPDAQVVQENIAFIQQTLRLNKQRIADLQQQLRNASRTNKDAKAAYETMVEEFNRQLEQKASEIEALRAQLEEKDVQLAAQGQQITELNDNVQTLTDENTRTRKTVADQDAALHTAWYAFGTRSELKAHNILVKGDVLQKAEADKSYFTKIDTRVTRTISFRSTRAEIMTSHPAGSYTLEKDALGQYALRITSPDAFWSISKYLVVQVK